ncbi:hypothetical protein N9L25_03350 [Gammaproteobacteria bacterium]|nr:hypothetical protein [Gammaproteobacteria bacterium]
MNDFYKKLKENIKALKNEKTKTIFTIATTSKQENYPYLTPVRKNNLFVVCGCVIFEQSLLEKIIKLIDGEVDYIFVDTEKKIPVRVHPDLDTIETGNLSKICFQEIKKSKILEYKPNDITVNATWSFLSQRLNFLSGKKISILGAGNIGSKLALKLVECGSSVSVHRRNSYKGHSITQGLNFVKPQNTLSNITFHEDMIQATFMSDVLIGATNGISIIDIDLIKSIKADGIIVDLGKNSLTKEAVEFAHQKNIEVYRTDVTAALEGFIHEAIKMDEILNQSYGKKVLDNFTIVGGGFHGMEGDIVVDNISNPKLIFGVAAGDGTLKTDPSSIDKERLSKLKENLKKLTQ